MSIHVKKKLEKENCNVHIGSDTCYSKDLMRGLRPVVLALSLPSPSCFSSLLLLIALLFGLWRKNCPFYVPGATEEEVLWLVQAPVPAISFQRT